MVPGNVNPSSTAPSTRQEVLTFSDTVDLAIGPTRAVILNIAGTVSYVDAEGNTVSFSFPAGQFSISLRRINSTGTDAALVSNILGLF